MFNIHDVKIGEVVFLSGYYKRKWRQTFVAQKYGVVVSFTKGGIPRVMPISNWELNPDTWDYDMIVKFSYIIINPALITKDAWLRILECDQAYRGKMLPNYNHLLKLIQNGKNKNESLLNRKQEKIDFSW